MSIIDTLITDRTQTDVDRLFELYDIGWDNMTEAERAEFMASKGGYNASDLNRVEEAVSYLAEILRELPDELEELCVKNEIHLKDILTLPYDPLEYNLVTKTDWTRADFRKLSGQMGRYLGNAKKLRSALDYATDELPQEMETLDLDGANAIENALVGLRKAIDDLIETVERYIRQVVAAFKRSNQFTFWSGSQPLPAKESDKGRTWEELDAMNTTWENWQVADWYLLLYGNLKSKGEITDGIYTVH